MCTQSTPRRSSLRTDEPALGSVADEVGLEADLGRERVEPGAGLAQHLDECPGSLAPDEAHRADHPHHTVVRTVDAEGPRWLPVVDVDAVAEHVDVGATGDLRDPFGGHRRHGGQRHAGVVPAARVTEQPEDRRAAGDDTVPGRGDRDTRAEGDADEVGREGAHHAHVGVRDVEAAGGEQVAYLVLDERVDRGRARHGQRQAVHRDATGGRRRVRAGLAGGGRDDLDLVPGRGQPVREVVHLHLDPAEAGQVAVRQKGDPHERPPCHASGWTR